MTKKVRFAKVVIAGDPAVGKTSLRTRFLGKPFKAEYLETLGADFANYETKIDDILLKWQIWDLAGHIKFYDVLKLYYSGSFGAVVVYDITRPETLESITNWAEDIWNHNAGYGGKIPLTLLSNKIDLKNYIAVGPDAGKELATTLALKRKGPVPYFETSAKTGDGVKEAFEELGRLIIDFMNKIPENRLRNKVGNR
ncbi:MAG: Rab family GTPase [Candidatus Hodarchaeales archaeon]|jgi:small GTP-binding protein